MAHFGGARHHHRVIVDASGVTDAHSSVTGRVDFDPLPEDWPAARLRIEQQFWVVGEQARLNEQAAADREQVLKAFIQAMGQHADDRLISLVNRLEAQQHVEQAVDARGFLVTAVGILVSGVSSDLASHTVMADFPIVIALLFTACIAQVAWRSYEG